MANADAAVAKKKTGMIVVVVIAAMAAWWFFLSPQAKSSETEEVKPGEVVMLDPIQVNLAAGHYLRVGVALQLTEGATEVSGAKALDETIATFSGLPVGNVNSAEFREKLKQQLVKNLDKRYDGAVMDVYFTDYVTQ